VGAGPLDDGWGASAPLSPQPTANSATVAQTSTHLVAPTTRMWQSLSVEANRTSVAAREAQAAP
jgi:hypothetical protein